MAVVKSWWKVVVMVSYLACSYFQVAMELPLRKRYYRRLLTIEIVPLMMTLSSLYICDCSSLVSSIFLVILGDHGNDVRKQANGYYTIYLKT